MHRREFVRLSSGLGLGLGLGFNAIKKWHEVQTTPYNISQLANTSTLVENDFRALVTWLRSEGWADYLKSALGVNLSLEGEDLKKELIKELNADALSALRNNRTSGFDDFSGNRLIEPGFPAYSLLFHAIASPRVRPTSIKQYPALQQIDTLENYIYAICTWEQFKSIYNIQPADELVFGVFAYEYRPAFKTPHQAHADLVYSRTGIARIGTEAHHYDSLNRCHTATPANTAKIKGAAVMPARYALFIARKVKNSDISLVRSIAYKGNDSKDDREDATKFFLQPIRKVFNNDELMGNEKNINLAESHKTEKLRKFADFPGIEMLNGLKPEHRNSERLIVQDDKFRKAGSSFLVISQHADLIRPATEQGHVLFFKVPKRRKKKFDTRYFTALCTQEVEDVELLEDEQQLSRIYNRYDDPRNQPLFVNITNKKNNHDEGFAPVTKTANNRFKKTLDRGGYYAPLFEDNICDGKVYCTVKELKLEGKPLHFLPAFSIVTAPDFFPQVDPLDLIDFDIAPGLTKDDSNFYEGGVASLATARIIPNPKMLPTDNESTKDTYLAVLSHLVKEKNNVPPQMLNFYKDRKAEKGYEISSFLPDVASSVFAPGWDVTYCSLEDKKDKNETDIYVGTEGLGSPFIEDMKFCAALNGMWPATSPDSARTFQGSNEADYRNPTAVPLLDVELGICGKGPAGQQHENWGWDGEQGPYLEYIDKTWAINFTDLGRADAVNNTLQGKVDLSQLRKLRSSDLIDRMECLRRCIKELPTTNFRDSFKRPTPGLTYLWLASAEQVNWGEDNGVPALGIPANLVGTDKQWITNKANAKVKGPGYLYLFVDSEPDGRRKKWDTDLKRRRLNCKKIYVCQVTNNAASPAKIAWAEITDGQPVQWNVK